MTDRIVSPEKTVEDIAIAKTLRPQSFSEFIGQQNIVDRLFLATCSASERGEPLDHMIFVGEPGLGKTTLARLVGGNNLHETSAMFLTDTKISGIMCEMIIGENKKNALFLDEIHTLKKGLAEMLYPIMEDGVMLSTGVSSDLKVPPFTLIGATTMYGKIAPPMRDRFTHIFRLQPYSHLELSKMLVHSRAKLNVDINDLSIVDVARRARGVPRIANRFLKIIRDYAKIIDEKIVAKAFKDLGVDTHGMDNIDRAYLRALQSQGKPLGVITISSLLGVSEEEIEEVIEPWLLRQEFAVKTPRGRAITSKGIMVLAE